MKEGIRRRSVIRIGVLLTLCLGTSPVWAQSKDIKSEEVLDRRSTSPVSTPGNKTSTVPQSPVTYQSSRPFTKVHPPKMEFAQLGVTVWRLLKQDGSDPQEACAEAQLLQPVESATAVGPGSMIRLGIEPLTRDGFVYVINREQFSDNSFGKAQLIFPKTNVRDGNPWVRKDQLLLIPNPSCFRINPSNTGRKQTAEILTIIVSPTPLKLPAPLTDSAMLLDDSLVREWERKWFSSPNVLKMNAPVASISLQKTHPDGAKSIDDVQDKQQLTNDDPYPRTIYRFLIRRGGTLLVTVPLRFKQ